MSTKESSFSIIMTVFNNASELNQNLPSFLTQTYKFGYQVIVVDESSTDNTEDVLKLLKKDYPHLYTTFLPRPNLNVTRKRLALTIGMKAVKNEWVIVSDIQRSPASTDWLTDLSEAINSSSNVILGYFSKKGLRLQTFETPESASCLIRKAERMRTDGHKGRYFKYLRGKYDFIAVRKEQGHEVLKYFEQDIRYGRLLGLRLRIAVMCHNLR